MIHQSVLIEAENLVHGDRNEAYGHPLDNFTNTAGMWSILLGCEVTPSQVGQCLIAMKLCRESFVPKRDNLVDIAGYAEAVAWLQDEQRARSTTWAGPAHNVGPNNEEDHHE